MGKLKIHIRLPSGEMRQATGREAETLLALIAAGPRGLTSLRPSGPDGPSGWPAYICDFRKMGVPIEAMREPHEGGNHARYSMSGHVDIVWRSDKSEAA